MAHQPCDDRSDLYIDPETFMLLLGILSLVIAGHSPRSAANSATSVGSPNDTVWTDPGRGSGPDSARERFKLAPLDTPGTRPRPKVVEVSEWYYRRLTIHRYVAYATIPVFGLQYAAGEQLYNKSRSAPTWAKTFHRVGATTLAAMFTVNTVTGAWNWWDSRSVKQGRALRTLHALAMLGADGAFTYAGAKLSDEAENSADKRRLHRTIALSAMGVTMASGIAMKLWNR